ncbi:MAG: hypothetical protein IJS05_06855 [Paludibacteraceae bacterium]|nr:hypothetical protein [Paludibacteraceae bacterium]
MKAIKTMSIVAVAAMLAACGGSKDLQFSKTQMTMPVGQTSDVSILDESTAATWTTANSFIASASADPGIATTVKANHVGETTLTATISDTKKGNLVVKVEPTISLLSRAIDFSIIGKSLSELQAKFGEPETIVNTVSNNQTLHFARYIDTNNQQQYVYMLDDKDMVDYVQIYIILSNANQVTNYDAYLKQWGELVSADQQNYQFVYIDGATPETTERLGYPVAQNIIQFQNTGQTTSTGSLLFAIVFGKVEFTQSASAPAKVKGL